MYELFYTSLPRGLVPGTSGYTTVGHTSEMSRTLIEQAEKLSSFSFLSGDPTAYAREPVSWTHLRVGSGGQAAHVVSRIAACVPDYTGRSNYLAHHAFLTSQEAGACKAGPAALAATPGFLETQWQGEARFLPVRGAPAVMDRGRTTSAIESAGIDPGWAGALADRLRDRNMRQTFLVYPPGTNIIGIVGDVLADLSPEERWQATFATHATKTFPGLGVECRLQCVVAGTPYAQDVLKRFPSDAFNLANLPSPPARVQRPRTSAAAAGPRPSPASKPLMAPPGSATRSARTETYATEPEQTFDLNSLRMPTITQPPIETRSHGGFGSLLFLVPTVLAALMTIGSTLLAYQWIQKGQQLADLTKRYDSLEGKHDDLKQQLDDVQKTLASVRKELEAKKEQVAVQAPAKTEVAPPKTELPKPNSEKEATDGKAAMADAEDGGKTPGTQVATNNPATGTTSTDVEPSGGQQGKADGKAKTLPRVPENVQSLLAVALAPSKKTPPKGSSVPLVENLDAPPSVISLDNEKLCEVLEAEIERRSKTWTVKVVGKEIADIKYDSGGKTLVLDLKDNSPIGYLARFLTVRVDVTGGQKLPPIPLGSPLTAKLQLEEQADENPKGTITVRKVFSDGEANALLGKMLKQFEGKKLYESIEFFPDARIESFTRESESLPKTMQKPAMPDKSFVLVRQGSPPRLGVVLTSEKQEPGEYALHGFVIDPLQYGPLASDKTLGGHWYFSNRDCDVVAKLLVDDLGFVTKSDQKQPGVADRKAKLEAARVSDTAARKDAEKFLKENLLKNQYPVRFELKVPDSDVGFVLVDSLSTPGEGK